MDKDMERLGKERLKRVKRRRQLATFVVSMAVIVLSITMYRLIQPASQKIRTSTSSRWMDRRKHIPTWGNLKILRW